MQVHIQHYVHFVSEAVKVVLTTKLKMPAEDDVMLHLVQEDVVLEEAYTNLYAQLDV